MPPLDDPPQSRIRTALSTTTLLALSIAAASAHPGHALDAKPVSHLVTSPYHLVALVMTGTGLLSGAALIRRLVARRKMQVTGTVALGVIAMTVMTQHLH
jgi:hypothetical protein